MHREQWGQWGGPWGPPPAEEGSEEAGAHMHHGHHRHRHEHHRHAGPPWAWRDRPFGPPWAWGGRPFGPPWARGWGRGESGAGAGTRGIPKPAAHPGPVDVAAPRRRRAADPRDQDDPGRHASADRRDPGGGDAANPTYTNGSSSSHGARRVPIGAERQKRHGHTSDHAFLFPDHQARSSLMLSLSRSALLTYRCHTPLSS